MEAFMLPHRETEQPIPIPLVNPTSRFAGEQSYLVRSESSQEPPELESEEVEYPFMEFSS